MLRIVDCHLEIGLVLVEKSLFLAKCLFLSLWCTVCCGINLNEMDGSDSILCFYYGNPDR